MGRGGAAAGLEVVPFLFENTGSATCRLSGYPGVTAVDASGKRIFAARQTLRGAAGGVAAGADQPPVVDLKPGQTASALQEFEAPAESKTIPCATIGTVRAVQVTLPGTGSPTSIPWNLTGLCSDDLQIHPAVPGTTGRQGG